MTADGGHTQMPHANANTTTKPLALSERIRYESALDISSAIRGRVKAIEVLKVICEKWRFCANISRWRLMHQHKDTLTIYSCDGNKITHVVKNVDDLSSSETMLWDNRAAAHITKNDIATRYTALQDLFDHPSVGETRMLVFDHATSRGQPFAMVVGSGETEFNRLDLKFINAIASILVSEISYLVIVTTLKGELQKKVREDALTGLENRRGFTNFLSKYWRHAMREQTPLSLIMIDVDHFKNLNDQFGHMVGDKCLKNIATTLQENLRSGTDVCARIGGEEFAILLPDTDLELAQKTAQRLLKAVDQCAIPTRLGETNATVTISIGCTSICPGPEMRSDILLKTADDALYDAKRQGRHRVCARVIPSRDEAPAEIAAAP